MRLDKALGRVLDARAGRGTVVGLGAQGVAGARHGLAVKTRLEAHDLDASLPRERLEPRRVGIALEHLGGGARVARHGEGLAREHAGEHLGRAAEQRVVVHEHVVRPRRAAGFPVCAQPVHGEVGQLGFQDASREGEALLDEGVRLDFLVRDEPGGVVVRKLRPAAVEELEHLA